MKMTIKWSFSYNSFVKFHGILFHNILNSEQAMGFLIISSQPVLNIDPDEQTS